MAKSRSFWIVTPDGKVHGLLGQLEWAKGYTAKIEAHIQGKVEGPFALMREAKAVAAKIKEAA